MAEFYSTEYAILKQTVVGTKTLAVSRSLKPADFSYTQVALATIADTIVLVPLPPLATLYMALSRFTFAGWAAGATLSVGWKAYKDVNGVEQAASAAGLLSAVLMTTDATWHNGLLVAAYSAPVVWKKDFNNGAEVVIYATIGVAAPDAADTLSGELVYAQV